MRVCVAVLLMLFGGSGIAQVPPGGDPQVQAAYPETEAAAALRHSPAKSYSWMRASCATWRSATMNSP
jgi:hypothetical protein